MEKLSKFGLKKIKIIKVFLNNANYNSKLMLCIKTRIKLLWHYYAQKILEQMDARLKYFMA